MIVVARILTFPIATEVTFNCLYCLPVAPDRLIDLNFCLATQSYTGMAHILDHYKLLNIYHAKFNTTNK